MGKKIQCVSPDELPKKGSPYDIAFIVQAASLAHDIGTTPFGHAGEQAIKDWFAKAKSKQQPRTQNPLAKLVTENVPAAATIGFEKFDGNAQGFRILSRLESSRPGGLRLTSATLGAYTKYPFPAGAHPDREDKFGFLDSEREIFETLATNLGLKKTGKAWSNHPLSLLMEAADDICYSVIDVEDGFQLGIVEFDAVCAALEPLHKTTDMLPSRRDQSEYVKALRSKAIRNLCEVCVQSYMDNYDLIMTGKFKGSIKTEIPLKRELENAKQFAVENIYATKRNLEIEASASTVIHGLLDAFSETIIALEECNWTCRKLRGREKKIASLHEKTFSGLSNKREAVERMVDLVSGMTDHTALWLYRKYFGISGLA